MYIKITLFYSPRTQMTQTHHGSRTARKPTPKISSASEGKVLKL